MKNRIVFLDYLRVIACFMVMIVHSCEPFYLGGDGVSIASHWNAVWATAIDSAVRACIALFVMASAYLLFPLTQPTGDFFRRRLKRVLIPFLIWMCIYTWRFDGSWAKLLFNFPADIIGGHLWFVPMLCGLYLIMPLISPWAEKVTRRELQGWLTLWAFTTTFPFLRAAWSFFFGAPSFGAVPYLYGECPWSAFGMFHYVSGFFGYMLLGFYFRKFAAPDTWPRTLTLAFPLWLIGYALVFFPFFLRLPSEGHYPFLASYATAVSLETSWDFASTGVALTALAYFLIIRKFAADGFFYRRIIQPLSEASYGTYLIHMLIMAEIYNLTLPNLTAPLAIFATALSTFILSSLISILIRRIPRLGSYLCG